MLSVLLVLAFWFVYFLAAMAIPRYNIFYHWKYREMYMTWLRIQPSFKSYVDEINSLRSFIDFVFKNKPEYTKHGHPLFNAYELYHGLDCQDSYYCTELKEIGDIIKAYIAQETNERLAKEIVNDSSILTMKPMSIEENTDVI